jgi:hypothetical protein
VSFGWLGRLGSGASIALLASWPATSMASTFELEYSAAVDCPSEEAFVAAVLSRAPSARRVLLGADVRFRVDASSSAGASKLWIDLPDGSSVREVQDPSCVEALTSMAVMAALLLEGRAQAVAAEPAASATVTPEPADESASPPPVLGWAHAPAARERPVNVSPRARSSSPELAFVAAVALETAAAPGGGIGGLVGVELAAARSGVWAPSIRAELLVTTESGTAIDGGDATFQLVAGRLTFCPVRSWPEGDLGVAACLLGEAGALQGSGGSVVNAETSTMPWLAGGLGLRGEWLVSQALSLETFANGKLLHQHDRFVLRPDLLIFDVPRISLGVGLGLAVRPF